MAFEIKSCDSKRSAQKSSFGSLSLCVPLRSILSQTERLFLRGPHPHCWRISHTCHMSSLLNPYPPKPRLSRCYTLTLSPKVAPHTLQFLSPLTRKSPDPEAYNGVRHIKVLSSSACPPKILQAVADGLNLSTQTCSVQSSL